MRFLLKAAILLSVVILLLPSPAPPPGGTALIGASDLASAGSAVIEDMRQICSRRPDACAVGSQAVSQFGQKAQAGAKMLYDFLTERFGTQQATPTANQANPLNPTVSARKPSQNTLTPLDLGPAWRG